MARPAKGLAHLDRLQRRANRGHPLILDPWCRTNRFCHRKGGRIFLDLDNVVWESHLLGIEYLLEAVQMQEAPQDCHAPNREENLDVTCPKLLRAKWLCTYCNCNFCTTPKNPTLFSKLRIIKGDAAHTFLGHVRFPKVA